VPALRPPNVNAVTATQVSLFWLPPADAVARYELARNGVVLPGVPPLAMSFLDSGLAPGTSYTYQLRIWTPDGRVSLFSPEITVTTTK
jgi:chitodextrinase